MSLLGLALAPKADGEGKKCPASAQWRHREREGGGGGAKKGPEQHATAALYTKKAPIRSHLRGAAKKKRRQSKRWISISILAGKHPSTYVEKKKRKKNKNHTQYLANPRLRFTGRPNMKEKNRKLLPPVEYAAEVGGPRSPRRPHRQSAARLDPLYRDVGPTDRRPESASGGPPDPTDHTPCEKLTPESALRRGRKKHEPEESLN